MLCLLSFAQAIATATPDEPSLVVLDNPSNTSLEYVNAFLTSKAGVIILSHNTPEEMKIDILEQGVSQCEVKPLSELQVTQRLVYSVQSNFHLPPNEENQNIFQQLALLCTGSPVLVKMVQSSLYHYITDSIKHKDTASDGLRNCWKEIEDSLAEGDTDPNIPEKVLAVIRTFNLSTSSERLLHCLSCLAGLPLPQECLDSIAFVIDPQQPQVRIRELLETNLLHGYPSPVITGALEGIYPSFFVPRVIADAVWVDSSQSDQYLSLLVLKQVLMQEDHPFTSALLCQAIAEFEAVLLEADQEIDKEIIPDFMDHYKELLHCYQSVVKASLPR